MAAGLGGGGRGESAAAADITGSLGLRTSINKNGHNATLFSISVFLTTNDTARRAIPKCACRRPTYPCVVVAPLPALCAPLPGSVPRRLLRTAELRIVDELYAEILLPASSMHRHLALRADEPPFPQPEGDAALKDLYYKHMF